MWEEKYLKILDNLQDWDPVHIAGGCYCSECIYHEQEEYPDTPDSRWIIPVDEYFCNLNSVTMPLNGFCSEGKNEACLEEK